MKRTWLQVYFNRFYNPVYDITTARLRQYRKLQERCVEKLGLRGNDRVLCIGLGTGNELVVLLGKVPDLHITGVDYSSTAIARAREKALKMGKQVALFQQDAHRLEFADGSFDKALCVHVMDFVDDDVKVTSELLRVLVDGGRFVATYPSGREGMGLGFRLLRDSLHHQRKGNSSVARVFIEGVVQVVAGMLYLPLLFRAGRKTFQRSELERILRGERIQNFDIEEDALYQDYLVCGIKR